SIFSNTQLVGIDIGATSIKYAVLNKTGRVFKLVNCGMRALQREQAQADGNARADRIANILTNEFKLKSYKNALLTSAVSGLEVIYKNIRVPKMGAKELAKAVPWACRKDFPFPIESTIFEYSVIEDKARKADEKLDVYVAAAQKEMVLNHVNLIRKSDSIPTKVSTIPAALWNLFSIMDKSYQSGCYAIIDIGGKSSHIVLINNGQLQFAREISTGGDDITQVLTGSIFVDGEEISISKKKAEGIKRKYGYLEKVNIESQEDVIPLKEIAVLMHPVLEKLVKEVQRTIDFFKEKFGIESIQKMFITGGTALLKNIPAYLSSELNTEVDVLNPFDYISAKKFSNHEDLNQLGPRLAVSLGLAIDKHKDLNLLPNEIRGVQASQTAKKLFRYVAVIAMLAMVFLSQNVKRQLRSIENEFQRRKTDYEIDRPKREKFLNLQRKINALNDVKAKYRKALDYKSDTAGHLKAISNIIPKNIALTSFTITQRETKDDENKQKVFIDEIVMLTGVAFQQDSMEGINLAQFLLDLEKANYFYDIVLKSQKIREDGNLEFLLECII
ncbi:type IV pilus assembly protein PilM, partial [bacterium]|nr:type IV pilus assembly protein PilM [bacterium]